MPFNALLLPLLAGYIYLNFSNLRHYQTAQIAKGQLLLHAAMWGLGFASVSRVVCLIVLQFDAGLAFAKLIHKVAPFPYIGTSLGALVIAGSLVWVHNLIVSRVVALYWLYHRGAFSPMMRMLWSSVIGGEPKGAPGHWRFTFRLAKHSLQFLRRHVGGRRLLYHTSPRELPQLLAVLKDKGGLAFAKLPAGPKRPLMFNMSDAKVIVGYVVDLPTHAPDAEYVTVAPLWTGYRGEDNVVLISVDYSAVFTGDEEDPSKFARVVRIADIATVSPYSDGTFTIAHSPGVKAFKGQAQSKRAAGYDYKARGT